MAKILVVDDDPNIRELIKVFLEEAGMEEVFEASDGVEALSVMDQTSVDLVVRDIMMPNMDGWE
ncbi:response regulator, partial [Clostridium perfringens]